MNQVLNWTSFKKSIGFKAILEIANLCWTVQEKYISNRTRKQYNLDCRANKILYAKCKTFYVCHRSNRSNVVPYKGLFKDKSYTIWVINYESYRINHWNFEFFKHCIRSRYEHCKNQTIKSIIKSITDYLKYHETSYSVYETFKFGKRGGGIHVEFAKFIALGNFVRIGKVFKTPYIVIAGVFTCFWHFELMFRDSLKDF